MLTYLKLVKNIMFIIMFSMMMLLYSFLNINVQDEYKCMYKIKPEPLNQNLSYTLSKLLAEVLMQLLIIIHCFHFEKYVFGSSF